MTAVKLSSKQLIECTRCASRCESPKCDDSAIEVVIVDPPNYRTVDPAIGRYRCRYGEFRDFPQTLPAGPPPPLAGFSWWNYEETNVTRRDIDGNSYIDVVHQGRRWTYRRVPAYTQFTFEPGRVYRTPAGFDVALLPD